MLRSVVTWILICGIALAASGAYEEALELYQHTKYEAALRLLTPLEPKSPEVNALIGKAYYGKGDFKAATEALGQAVEAEPENSHFWDWLGKAYGRRAENSSFLTAPSYASRCRKAFEMAVRLAPDNLEALNDLFSYSLEAPGFLGGGVDKAEALADRIRGLNEPEYQWALAELARKRKDYAAAEQHLRKALELEPQRVGRILDLAKFLARQGRLEESEKLFNRARQVAPKSPKVLFARASAYAEANTKLDEARRLLTTYVASDLTPDDPPRKEAEELLAKLKSD